MENRTLSIAYSPKETDVASIMKLIKKFGYAVSLKSGISLPTPEVSPNRFFKKTIYVDIQGMVCQSCIKAIKNALKEYPDITNIDISLDNNLGVFTFDSSKVSTDQIITAIQDCGFDASEKEIGLCQSPSQDLDYENIGMDQDIEMKTLKRKKSMITADSKLCRFTVLGMFCGSCVSSIEKSLRATPGILGVSVSLLAQSAEVRYDSLLIEPSKIAEKIEELGFEAQVMKEESKKSVTLRIFGMTCASCSGSIELGISKIPGIKKVSVNLLGQTGVFEYDKEIIGIRDIISHIEDMGFNAVLDNSGSSAQLESLKRTKEILKWKNTFFYSCVWGVPVAFITMILPLLISNDHYNYKIISGIRAVDILLILLTIPIQFGVGRVFLEAAYKSVRHGVYTMVFLFSNIKDVLITLGTTLSFVFSLISIVYSSIVRPETPTPVFFELCAMLICFVSFGRYLENIAKGNTTSALSKLISLSPAFGTLIERDASGNEIEKQIAQNLIEENDIFKVRPGEKIPVDGVVIYGETTVDESLITGEPFPVLKVKDDIVIGGTINLTVNTKF
jgi:Cu+-exporting ATPase